MLHPREAKLAKILKKWPGLTREHAGIPERRERGSLSTRRMYAALDAQVLDPAVDAAVSAAGAANSLEKMLVHQMTVVHFLGIKPAARALADNPTLRAVDQVRLMNTAARMFDSYQAGMQTWQRWEAGASQTVTVQHVHQHVQVADGGLLYHDHVGGRGRDLFRAVRARDLESFVAKPVLAPYRMIGAHGGRRLRCTYGS